MGYVMSREFLLAHKDLILKFIDLADNGGAVAFRCADPQELTELRYKINNLLRCFASWHPNQAYVRAAIRTWVSYDTTIKSHLLHVGNPPHQLRGRKPDTITALGGRVASVVVITDEITAANYQDVMLRLSTAVHNKAPTITIEQPPNEAGVDYLSDKLAPDYTPVDNQAVPLVYERKG